MYDFTALIILWGRLGVSALDVLRWKIRGANVRRCILHQLPEVCGGMSHFGRHAWMHHSDNDEEKPSLQMKRCIIFPCSLQIMFWLFAFAGRDVLLQSVQRRRLFWLLYYIQNKIVADVTSQAAYCCRLEPLASWLETETKCMYVYIYIWLFS